VAAVEPFAAAVARGACPDRAEAEDALQESLLELCRSLPSLADDRALLPWLRQIVQHRAADRGRRRAVRREVALESAADRPAGAEPGGAELEGAERRRELLAALAALPAEDRELLALRHEAGLSLEEVAAATGQSPRAVESRLFRARRALRERLSGGTGR
jgi:RNA polymerase sigma factor (sigma-70 family)